MLSCGKPLRLLGLSLVLSVVAWGCSKEAPQPVPTVDPVDSAVSEPDSANEQAAPGGQLEPDPGNESSQITSPPPLNDGVESPEMPAPADTPPPATEVASADRVAKPAETATAKPAEPAASSSGSIQVDPKLPTYTPVAGVSGTLKSVGSDTMNNLMTLWAEDFRNLYPSVRVEIEGKGSGTAPPALIAGTAQFGPMSRDMKDGEAAEFKQKFGYEPTLLQTGVDLLAVYVNKSNPIEKMTLAEADAIFSETRRLGHDPITKWSQVGVQGRLAELPISLYGRNAASGTYGFFKEKVLADGDFKSSVKEQPGSSAVVQGVAEDEAGVGYSGIGYMTSGVKALSMAKDQNAEAIPPDAANVYNGKYPLFRFLNVYINKQPNQELDPLRREFIKYIFSQQGQRVVIKDGYFPIPASLAKKQLSQLGIGSE